ncbi:MAG: hypothetical protein HC869_11825, partial [Rhodospirillales bacterium]|nr:hypothetical protein [Rhodospirillales bacterium]
MHAFFTTHEFPLHTHEAFVVAVTETGGSMVKSRGHIEQAHHEALFVFNPGEPHAGWMGPQLGHWRYRSFRTWRNLSMDAVSAQSIVRV